jgi:uncharacterized membrane protein YebE (DUF533 family)
VPQADNDPALHRHSAVGQCVAALAVQIEVSFGAWLLTTRVTEAVEKRTDADWILKAMVAIAAADGRLDAREVGLIRKVYQEQTGRSVDVSAFLLAVQAYANRRDVLAELSAAAGTLSRETGREIIRAAYLTLLADKRIAKEERKKRERYGCGLATF